MKGEADRNKESNNLKLTSNYQFSTTKSRKKNSILKNTTKSYEQYDNNKTLENPKPSQRTQSTYEQYSKKYRTDLLQQNPKYQKASNRYGGHKSKRLRSNNQIIL